MTFSHKFKSVQEKELPASNLYRRIAWKEVNIKGKDRRCVKGAIMDYSQSAKL